MKRQKRIGIFGGSFDPPHTGHLMVAASARAQLRLDEVYFVPAYQPPHKNGLHQSTAAERLAMTRLAARSNRCFRVSDIEIRRKGVSFTIDTVRYFRQKFPTAELFFIMGGDSINQFLSWKSPEEILTLAHLAVYHREGERKRTRVLKKKLFFLTGELVTISSTEIRQRMRRGEPVRSLVPELVYRYIKHHNLFTPEKIPPMKITVDHDEMMRIIDVDHFDPFRVLGMQLLEQKGKASVVVRAFLPDALSVFVVELDDDHEIRSYAMQKVDEAGFFECCIPERSSVFRYKLRKETQEGTIETFYDSYSFLPTLTDFDLYLFNAGDHHRIYEKLGAHYAEVNGVGGIQFAVWAPSARNVSLIGSFNGWDRRKHAMRSLGSSGVWEIFIPGLPEGELYKFQVKKQDGTILDKCDPYGFEMELRPSTAARVNLLTGFEWRDQEWIQARTVENHLVHPLSIYEVHLASWARQPEENNRWLTYRELAHKLVEYVKQRGFTHLELMPVMEHPFDASWGYQVTGYFAPTSRFGKPQDFMYFVNHCHENGIGVILDWVPAHFPKDVHALGEFDGTHLYEHADPKKGEHQDWGTYIFNYGRHEVKNFLISNALYWIDKYHIDGLRIDAVASMLYLDYSRQEGEWIPNQYGGRENIEAIEFLRATNTIIHHYYPGVLTIAEESTAWPGVTNSVELGGLGFDLKWNMGWMHDMLEYFSKDPIYRSYQHRNLTFALLYAFTEKFLLPLSHDEVVHGKKALLDKMPGDLWQKFANLRALYSLMFAFPGKKLLFMGGEFGQWKEWDHETSLDWHLLEYDTHHGLLRLIDDIQSIYQNTPALYENDFHYQGFEWIDFRDAAGSVISFIRKAKYSDEKVIIVCNFTPVPRTDYRIGIPEQGTYRELFNSDSAYYGGGNVGNCGIIEAEPIPLHHRDYSLLITLPPLGILYLKREEPNKA